MWQQENEQVFRHILDNVSIGTLTTLHNSIGWQGTNGQAHNYLEFCICHCYALRKSVGQKMPCKWYTGTVVKILL